MREKGLQKQKRRRSTGQQPGTKSAFRPIDKQRINRLSTGFSVPPSVYIGFRLFVLLEGRSGDVSLMPWRVRGTVVSWANCSVCVQSCPTPPRRPAERPDPTRPWYVRDFPNIPCVKRIYKDKKCVRPLVSSQEQRALLVPVINRLSAGCQPLAVFRHRFT